MNKQELEALLGQDPGNGVFADYAELLRSEGQIDLAMDSCLRGLSINPGIHKGRLTLARLYYEKGFLPFAIRELELLRAALPDNRSISKLLEKFQPGSTQSNLVPHQSAESSSTIAESEFEVGDLDLLDEDDEK